MRGVPPKVVWLRLGNCTTDDVARVLRGGFAQITAFASDPVIGVLELI